jgi:hypothetical protein
MTDAYTPMIEYGVDRDVLVDVIERLEKRAQELPNRELSLALTNAEQALMWYERIDWEKANETRQPRR